MSYFKRKNSNILKPYNPSIHQITTQPTFIPCSILNCSNPGKHGQWTTSRNVMRVLCNEHVPTKENLHKQRMYEELSRIELSYNPLPL